MAGTPGPDNELSGLVVMRWNLFDGMITRHRRMELAQRWQQAMAERDAATRSNAEEIDPRLPATRPADSVSKS